MCTYMCGVTHPLQVLTRSGVVLAVARAVFDEYQMQLVDPGCVFTQSPLNGNSVTSYIPPDAGSSRAQATGSQKLVPAAVSRAAFVDGTCVAVPAVGFAGECEVNRQERFHFHRYICICTCGWECQRETISLVPLTRTATQLPPSRARVLVCVSMFVGPMCVGPMCVGPMCVRS
jgi:hypothetical protein